MHWSRGLSATRFGVLASAPGRTGCARRSDRHSQQCGALGGRARSGNDRVRWFGRRGSDGHDSGNNGSRSNGHAGNGVAVAEAKSGHGDGKSAGRPNQGSHPSLLLTYDGWLVGHIVHSENRVLDALNTDTLRVRTDEGMREIDRDEVLVVVPPPITTSSALRIAKQPIPVSVDIGVGTLHGQIHVLPGVSPWETWQRSTSGFVAVTGAIVDFPDGTTETADVVLVSRHAAHAGLLV